jgi:NhaP-type Na+/H+ or K+/H+ antiporter
VAEHYHSSGVLAALTASLVVGNYRPSGWISGAGRHALETLWGYVAFIANSLIFILIGLQEAEQHFRGLWLPARCQRHADLCGRALPVFAQRLTITPLLRRLGQIKSRHEACNLIVDISLTIFTFVVSANAVAD